MKNSQPIQPDDPFQRALGAWKVEVEIPARFQSEVWQRIATQESSRADSVWSRVRDWIGAEFAKPGRAAAVLATGLLLSAVSAYLQAENFNSQQQQQLEARYINSINPLAEGHST